MAFVSKAQRHLTLYYYYIHQNSRTLKNADAETVHIHTRDSGLCTIGRLKKKFIQKNNLCKVTLLQTFFLTLMLPNWHKKKTNKQIFFENLNIRDCAETERFDPNECNNLLSEIKIRAREMLKGTFSRPFTLNFLSSFYGISARTPRSKNERDD